MANEPNLMSDAAARAAALHPGSSFIVQAPAGSGKTELLTQRYLALLATVDEPEEIVAITFTRKAAGEMRLRIVEALENAEGEAPKEPHKRLTWELGRRAQIQDKERGWQLQAHPARMRIQTIDSLNAELTRQMPLLSRFGAQPGVNERPETLYQEAARRTLRLLEDGDGRQQAAVAELALHLDNNLPRMQALLADMLPRRDQWLRPVRAGAPPTRTELETALEHEVDAHLARLSAAIPSDCYEDLIWAAAQAGRTLKVQSSTSPIAECAGLKALPDAVSGSLSLWHGLAELLLTKEGDWRRSLNKNQGFPPEEGIAKARAMDLLQRLARHDDLQKQLAAVRRLPETRYPERQWRVLQELLTLLPLAVAQLRLVFAEHSQADFTEISLGALTALGDIDSPSDLALRLDYRLRHLLVDEFQDTSVNQLQLLEKLTAGWQEDDGRTLFLVGDPMQSIYRFREAEVGLFLRVWQQGLGQLRPKPLRLQANFRSQAGLVSWYNWAFRSIFPPKADVASGAVPYAESAAQQGLLAGTAVQVHAFFDEIREQEAQRVCEVITAAQAENKDASIAVLARAKGHLATIVRSLRRRGLAFQALEIESLSQQAVVQDLLALTRALAHAGDRSAWLAALRAPWCGLSLAELHALATADEDACIPELLRTWSVGNSRYRWVQELLLAALTERGRGSLRQQVERLWLRLGGPAALASAEELADAEAFFELLEELDEGGALPSALELERRLDSLFARPDPEADGSLQLMTVHKAKGLEFDVVILPGLDASTRRGEKDLLVWLERPRKGQEVDLLLAPLNATGEDRDPVYEWVKRLRREQEQLEAGRLLYVAATRARQRLHLLGGTRVVEEDGKATVAAPKSGSLLALLWPMVAAEFAAVRGKHATAADRKGSSEAHRFLRIKPEWQAPSPGTSVAWQGNAVRLAGDPPLPEFKWVGERLRHVGTVVHKLLQRVAAEGAEHWQGEKLKGRIALIRQLLAETGVREEDAALALEEALEAVGKALDDPRGRWLLDAKHTQARSEYALSSFDAGRLVTGVIDRTFVDAEGVRWIVDYKTSRHSGTDVDAFLQNERARYAPQLERYAKLLAGLETRRVKVALYFPLLQRLVEWEPVHGPES